jgi:glutathione S-transferase
LKPPVLYHIQISHYNEKARWALDYKRIPHVRRAPPPLLHMAWAYAMTRSNTFPVLVIDGEKIGDSTRIIEALERRHPEPPLYPAHPAQRQRALELEDFFDEEMAPYLRRMAFHEAVRDSDVIAGAAMPGASGMRRRAFRATAPVAARVMRVRYGLDDEGARVARDKTLAAMDRLAAEIGPSGYLVGDGFTVADLAAASLFMPLVRPPEMQYAKDEHLPEGYVRFRDSVSTHPVFPYVREMYRRHRGHSAEIGATPKAA